MTEIPHCKYWAVHCSCLSKQIKCWRLCRFKMNLCPLEEVSLLALLKSEASKMNILIVIRVEV